MRQVDKKAFGRRVQERRESLGISQTELAEAVGMRQQGINNIETGANQIGIDSAIKLRAKTGATLDYIFLGIIYLSP